MSTLIYTTTYASNVVLLYGGAYIFYKGCTHKGFYGGTPPHGFVKNNNDIHLMHKE